MKKITDFSDVQFIVNHKRDVRDGDGYVVPFVCFLGMSLLEIIQLCHAGDWTYDVKW